MSRLSRTPAPPGRTQFGPKGGTSEHVGAVVVSVALTVAALVPSSVTVPGDGVHAEGDGAPMQLIATVWLNPPMGDTLIV